MNRTTLRLLTSVAALALLANSALAGPLPTDPNALPGWQGTASFSGATGSNTLKVSVEFAVYAPGQFGASAALGHPSAADPSGGQDYVYAYEAFNNAPGTALLTSLSIGLNPGAIPNGSTRIGNDPSTPALGTAPNLSQFIPTTSDPKASAKWSYTTTSLGPGSHSDILLFTSPFGPQDILASIVGGHATFASSTLPTPVPEPSTVALAALALVGLLAIKGTRKRSA